MSGTCEGEVIIPNPPPSAAHLEKIQAHHGMTMRAQSLTLDQMCFLGASFPVTWW